MSKVRYWCRDLPWRRALGQCRDFPPSYDVDSESEYEKELAEGLELLDDETLFRAKGHRRQAHLMVPGGRTHLRFPQYPFPADRRKGGPERQGSSRTKQSSERLLGVKPPWDARTQSPYSRWQEAAMAAKNPVLKPVDRLHHQIVDAIDRYRTLDPEGSIGFRVPYAKQALVTAGFPSKIAWILTERAPGRLFTERMPAEPLRPSVAIALALGGPLQMAEADYAPRIIAGAGTAKFGRRGLTVDEIVVEHLLTGNGESYSSKVLVSAAKRLSAPGAVAVVVDDAVAQTLEDREWKAEEVTLVVVSKGQVVTRVSLGEHSKSSREFSRERKPDYRTFQNVSLAELPDVLVRVAQHRGKKTGRRLPEIQAGFDK